MILGNREHPARSAGRVVEGLHDTRLGEDVVVFDEEQVHHQADDLARGEVLSRRLVRQLREAADQFFVQVAHLQVRDGLRVEVDLAELRDDQVEELRAVQPLDLNGEVEPVQHLPRTRREALDVRH